MKMTNDELKTAGAEVARALQESGVKSNGDLPRELRARFIAVRSELFRRGIFDPVLGRFDSATVTQASTPEIADQLARLFATM